MSAQAKGWGTGWPKCQSSKMKTVVRPDGVKLPVHQDIAFIVAHLCAETERRGYDLVPGWCWGFACRPIRGSSSPSNHSWGLAVDLNAPKNPMGSKLITNMPNWMVGLWEAHMFRWGGKYKSRPDAMHYEFMGTPADAKRIADSIRRSTAPVSLAKAFPIQRTSPITVNCLVAEIQEMGNEFNRKNHTFKQIEEDGKYGNDSADMVVAFKKWNQNLQRATGLPVWPNHDEKVGPITYGAFQFWTRD